MLSDGNLFNKEIDDSLSEKITGFLKNKIDEPANSLSQRKQLSLLS